MSEFLDSLLNNDEPELTLPVMRKRYKGKHIDFEKLLPWECSYSEKTRELYWEYSYLCTWSGEEYRYNITIGLDEEGAIKKLGALHCERLVSEDAASVRYRGKRADDFDYSMLDDRLERVVIEDLDDEDDEE